MPSASLAGKVLIGWKVRLHEIPNVS